MTIPRLQAMQSYWRRWPPVSKLIASYFGAGKEPPPKLDTGEADSGLFAALVQDAAQLNGGAGG